MTLQQILDHFKTQQNPARIKTNQRLNIEMVNDGVPMSQVRPIAKKLGKNHELGLELWNSDHYEAMILGSMILDPKDIDINEANQLIKKAIHPLLVDELSLGALRKISNRKELFKLWNEDSNPLIRRASWDLVVGLILDDQYTEPEVKHLLDLIEDRLVDSVEDEKWAMNRSLAEIGIKYEGFRPQVLELAERLGVYREMKVAKGCTSAYAPEWIAAILRRKK